MEISRCYMSEMQTNDLYLFCYCWFLNRINRRTGLSVDSSTDRPARRNRQVTWLSRLFPVNAVFPPGIWSGGNGCSKDKQFNSVEQQSPWAIELIAISTAKIYLTVIEEVAERVLNTLLTKHYQGRKKTENVIYSSFIYCLYVSLLANILFLSVSLHLSVSLFNYLLSVCLSPSFNLYLLRLSL